MEMYNPQKYCNRCKHPFTRDDPNPKFLSCKHLMCDMCFKTSLEGNKLQCPCGVLSHLPIPEHRVYPDLEDNAWDEMSRMGAVGGPVSALPRTSSWSTMVYASSSTRPPTSPPVMNRLTNGGDLGWSTSSRIADSENRINNGMGDLGWSSSRIADRENAGAYANVAAGWDPRPPSISPTEPELQLSLPDPRAVTRTSDRNGAVFKYPTTLDDSLRGGVDMSQINVNQILSDEPPNSIQQRSPPLLVSPIIQETGTMPVWTQLDNNNIFGRGPFVVEPRRRIQALISGVSAVSGMNQRRCARHRLDIDMWCAECDSFMCIACVLCTEHSASHILSLRPNPAPTENQFHDVIQVLNDHSQAIQGFSLMVSYLERETVSLSAKEFIKEFIGIIEENRDGLRDYERQSVELINKPNVRSIAFDVALDRPSKAFDDYLAMKISLEKMVTDSELKQKGSGVALLLKVASMFIYQNFRSSLQGAASTLRETSDIEEIARVDAATNTHPITEDPYPVWLGTLHQRAELAQRLTDKTAIIPPGWFINTLPNVFFVEFSLGQRPLGRVLIETNPDVAPVMSANFALLCAKTRNLSYQDCVVFQCWRNQSIITGDNETKNGTGGKSVLNDDFVVPDDSGMQSFRGAVGMRRLKKRISKAGEISSQFRIMLQEIKGITGIFGRVVKGIEIVEEISRFGDKNGNPRKVVTISNCGKI